MVFKDRWSLNTGGNKDRFHCISFYILTCVTNLCLQSISVCVSPCVVLRSPSSVTLLPYLEHYVCYLCSVNVRLIYKLASAMCCLILLSNPATSFMPVPGITPRCSLARQGPGGSKPNYSLNFLCVGQLAYFRLGQNLLPTTREKERV